MSIIAQSKRRRAAGLSLVEAIVSIVIVSVMLTAALNTLGGSRATQQRIADRTRGAHLAQELLNEVLLNAYADPNEVAVFGREPTETTAARRELDDVDDYHGWSVSPPQDRQGNALTDLTGWRRAVVVEYVDANAYLAVNQADTGVKRVTVTVYRNDVLMATATALKSAASD